MSGESNKTIILDVLNYFKTIFENKGGVVFENKLVDNIRALYDAYVINSYEISEVCKALGIELEDDDERNLAQVLYEYFLVMANDYKILEKQLERFSEFEVNIKNSNVEDMALEILGCKNEIDRLEGEYENLAARHEQAMKLLNQIGVDEVDLFNVDLEEVEYEDIEEDEDY